MAAGGAGGNATAGGNGATPSQPTMSGSLASSMFFNISKYLSSGSGGGGNGATAGSGGNGAEGVFGVAIGGNKVSAGNIEVSGNAGASGQGGGGGGAGAGAILIVYNASYTAGTYSDSGGGGGTGGGGANGGAGGAGQVITYKTFIYPSFTNPTYYYPLKYNASTSLNSINFNVSIINLTTDASTYLSSNKSITYVPNSSDSSTGYKLIFKETQGHSTLYLNTTFTLNMTTANSALNFSSPLQYFPILAHAPIWDAKPSSWYINSSSLVPQITQNTTAGAVFSTNVSGVFTPQIHLVYPFYSFILNYTQNPKVQNSISIRPFKYTFSDTINPSLREIANLSIYDQETFNSITGASVSFNISTTFNNYHFFGPASNDTETNGQYFAQIPLSNYENPPITFQLNGTVSKPLFFAPSQLFCPSTISNGSSAVYHVGLVDTNGTKYSFYISTSTGTNAGGYILFINEQQGISARGAESLIVPSSLPMAVPLEQTGQEYQYIIYSPNCKTTYYKGSFVDPTNPTYITLSSAASQAVFYNTTNVTGVCSLNSAVNPYKLVCAASDPNSEVFRYKLDIFNSTNVLGATSLVRQVYENSSTFSYNTTLPDNRSYSYALYAYAFKQFDPVFLVNGGPLNIVPISLSAPLLGVFALILMLTLAFTGIKTGKVLVLLLLMDVGLLAVSMLSLAQVPTIATIIFILIGLILSVWSIKAR